MRDFLTLALIALASAACSTSAHANPSPSIPATNPSPSALQPNPGTTANPINSLPEERFIDMAKQDLAARLKIDIDQITLLKATVITAADLASGCTIRAGQVVMPNESADGYQILLGAESQDYLYHAGLNGQLILCRTMNQGPNKPLLLPTPDLTQSPPKTAP